MRNLNKIRFSMKLRQVRRYFGFFMVPLIILIVYYLIQEDPSSIEYQMVLKRWNQSDRHYNGVKTILYWNKMYAEQHRHMMFGSGDVYKDCDVPHCYATPNRRLLNSLSDYDAIIFSGIEMNLRDLPYPRSPHQRYIYYSQESALSRPINDYEFVLSPNYYNWTMAFRLDSDIIRPYGVIRDIATNAVVFPPKNDHEIVQWRKPDNKTMFNLSNEVLSIIKHKTKMAAWFVSHCGTLSYRDELVEELHKYLLVDVYGSCGTHKCEIKTQDCYNHVEKDYFYYLSLENTICKDYMTEKVYLPMQKYVIPVVYGGANYTKFLPPHSYINVYDFQTIKDLANYMIKLANDPYEYASYFWWKKYYRIEDPTKFTLCNICAMLHNSSLPETSVKDFRKYYITDQCRSLKVHDNMTIDESIFGSRQSLS